VDKCGDKGIKDMYYKKKMANYKHISIGRLGEDIATQYLENRGFRTIERNYKKKCGEIDIISKKDNVLHFVEVKTSAFIGVFPEEGEDAHRPEDRVDTYKLARFRRVVELYVLEKSITDVYTCDVLAVYLQEETKKAKVIHIRDVSI
jgi:putative endonuclease